MKPSHMHAHICIYACASLCVPCNHEGTLHTGLPTHSHTCMFTYMQSSCTLVWRIKALVESTPPKSHDFLPIPEAADLPLAPDDCFWGVPRQQGWGAGWMHLSLSSCLTELVSSPGQQAFSAELTRPLSSEPVQAKRNYSRAFFPHQSGWLWPSP